MLYYNYNPSKKMMENIILNCCNLNDDSINYKYPHLRKFIFDVINNISNNSNNKDINAILSTADIDSTIATTTSSSVSADYNVNNKVKYKISPTVLSSVFESLLNNNNYNNVFDLYNELEEFSRLNDNEINLVPLHHDAILESIGLVAIKLKDMSFLYTILVNNSIFNDLKSNYEYPSYVKNNNSDQLIVYSDLIFDIIKDNNTDKNDKINTVFSQYGLLLSWFLKNKETNKAIFIWNRINIIAQTLKYNKNINNTLVTILKTLDYKESNINFGYELKEISTFINYLIFNDNIINVNNSNGNDFSIANLSYNNIVPLEKLRLDKDLSERCIYY